MYCGEPHIRADQILFLHMVSFRNLFLITAMELDGENGPITSAHTVMFTSELDMY